MARCNFVSALGGESLCFSDIKYHMGLITLIYIVQNYGKYYVRALCWSCWLFPFLLATSLRQGGMILAILTFAGKSVGLGVQWIWPVPNIKTLGMNFFESRLGCLLTLTEYRCRRWRRILFCKAVWFLFFSEVPTGGDEAQHPLFNAVCLYEWSFYLTISFAAPPAKDTRPMFWIGFTVF